MANDKNIKTEIKCKNLAPITTLDKVINSKSLQYAVYANNGEGKTFISNMFRLLENRTDLLQDKLGNTITDKFISLDKTNCDFSFKITDDEGEKEDLSVALKKGEITTVPTTKYIYHTFNQDYIDENSEVNYDKDGNITDYIIGKANIDVSKEEKKLKEKNKDKEKLYDETKEKIETLIDKKIGSIPHIKKLNEYKDYLYFEGIYNDFENPWTGLRYGFKDYLNDFDKIKSVPESLPKLQEVLKVDDNTDFIKTTIDKLKEKFDLSKVADDFKKKVLEKQSFIEKGLELLTETDKCPFCEQEIKDNALTLIDNYTSFIQDEETKTVNAFKEKKKQILFLIDEINTCNNSNLEAKVSFNNYVEKYFSSSKGVELYDLPISDLVKDLNGIIEKIENKIQDISVPIIIQDNVLKTIHKNILVINKKSDDNNTEINKINLKLDNLSSENKEVRRNLCKSLFNELSKQYNSEFLQLNTFKEDIKVLEESIGKKKEQNKINKREKVSKTIKSVLYNFFTDKYSLDEETFRLTFKKETLNSGQAKDVLSEGEKTIIAFAYFLGDTHLKLKKVEDYNRLFFIIDDPISSMDFNHVYTLSGIIRDLKKVFELDTHTRFIIFTHNIEFMRILVSNEIAKKSFVLVDSELKEFNNNLTVPYIPHLSGLYKISIGDASPNHTTANSIRHIIETLTKFEHLELGNGAIKKYIDEHFKDNIKTYTLINDLSHGAWRGEQQAISETDFILLCTEIVSHIEKQYKNQVEYCKNKII
jgi:wobble nucleotide-excising tRNase